MIGGNNKTGRAVPVTHPRRRVKHSRLNPTPSDKTDHDPKRRACLAFACWGVRHLLPDVLGVISGWGLKMIKRLDRVKPPAHTTAVFNNNKR